MPFDFLLRRFSLKARLILTYLVILAIGGLATSLVGSWIVSSTIMMQARRSVDRDLATARTLYDDQIQTLKRTVQLTASGMVFRRHFSAADRTTLLADLDAVHKDTGFDFLSLTDQSGRVILRVSRPDSAMDDVSSISVIRAALSGKVAVSTEVLSAEALGNEDPRLRHQAHLRLVATPRAGPTAKAEETSGMVQIAAAPVRGPNGQILGALYGGVLLNRNLGIVDRVWDVLYKGERFMNRDVGTVTIFLGDVRISTNVRTATGERALGTRVSEEIREAVLDQGRTWRSPAFVVDDWYIASYEPIRNYQGDIIGILYVGVLEKAYTSIRDRVILSFFGIATTGFILIIGITYYMIRSITQPIGKMVAATRNIAAGRFDEEVPAASQDEIGLLATSFNTMLQSLRQMKADLEEWGRTLEEKVKQRTEELVAMQARVAQSERLASLGKLAAGVAHEINNPLGGILSLTALTLEDTRKDDPNRENLEEVLRQTERCRDIVKGLLEFSRQTEVHAEIADLRKILQDTLSLIEKQALFFNINVVRDWDRRLPPVMADRSQLQQVFMNILINAVQAMEEKGTVTIAIRYSPSDKFDEVSISDTGCGIPPEKIDRIFDPFFSTKPSGHGTGLGLSIAYGIVADHRGTISVQSELGKGSTFTVRTPAAREIGPEAHA